MRTTRLLGQQQDARCAAACRIVIERERESNFCKGKYFLLLGYLHIFFFNYLQFKEVTAREFGKKVNFQGTIYISNNTTKNPPLFELSFVRTYIPSIDSFDRPLT